MSRTASEGSHTAGYEVMVARSLEGASMDWWFAPIEIARAPLWRTLPYGRVSDMTRKFWQAKPRNDLARSLEVRGIPAPLPRLFRM